MSQSEEVTLAIKDNPNNVHYVFPNRDKTVCGRDWGEMEYSTDLSEAVANRIGICSLCEDRLEKGGVDLWTVKEARAAVANLVDGVSPRPEDPGIIRKREWVALFEALNKEE